VSVCGSESRGFDSRYPPRFYETMLIDNQNKKIDRNWVYNITNFCEGNCGFMGGVVQLVERMLCMHDVAGSSPVASSHDV
jgi:hypothetical protein